MENKSSQQKWVEKHPLTWKILCKIMDFFLFVSKVALSLQILKVFGVV